MLMPILLLLLLMLFVWLVKDDDDDLAPDEAPVFVPIIETFGLFDPGRAGKSSELMVNSLCALSTDED